MPLPVIGGLLVYEYIEKTDVLQVAAINGHAHALP
jgi:hypothetical protein